MPVRGLCPCSLLPVGEKETDIITWHSTYRPTMSPTENTHERRPVGFDDASDSVGFELLQNSIPETHVIL